MRISIITLALLTTLIPVQAQQTCPQGRLCFPWQSSYPIEYATGIDVEWSGADVMIDSNDDNTAGTVYIKPLQECWRVVFAAGDFSAVWGTCLTPTATHTATPAHETTPTATPTPFRVWLLQVYR